MSRFAVWQWCCRAGTIAVLWLACAQVAPPPGGEVDKSGPRLVASAPKNGSINVEPGNTIRLYFSENVVQPAVPTVVYLSPRQAVAPRIKWKSDHIEIVLSESFHVDQTYIVSVSPAVTDLRNNRLDSSAIVAFSTGPMLDSGKISGTITADGKPQGGFLVALYDAAAMTDSVIYDSLYPRYLAQTTNDGRFAFAYLPRLEYRLLGFQDKNRDERFGPSREDFALPDRKIAVGGELPLDNLSMRVTRQDTLRPDIISVSCTPDRTIKIRLSREIPLDWLSANPSGLVLTSQADTGVHYSGLGLLESDLKQAAQLDFYLGDVPDGKYRVDFAYASGQAPITRPELDIKRLEDKRPPEIARSYPGSQAVFLSQSDIRLVFSEPLDTSRITAETFALWDSDNRSLAVGHNWTDAFHLRFSPEALHPGYSYRLVMTEFDLVDRAGNRLGDSLREYPFTILSNDSLGSVSGAIAIKLPDRQGDPVVLSFARLGSQQSFDLNTQERSFTMALPAGKYLLSGFIDSNRDGKRSDGAIAPFHLAETEARYADTISVRARFETSGIEFEFR